MSDNEFDNESNNGTDVGSLSDVESENDSFVETSLSLDNTYTENIKSAFKEVEDSIDLSNFYETETYTEFISLQTEFKSYTDTLKSYKTCFEVINYLINEIKKGIKNDKKKAKTERNMKYQNY